MKKRCLLLVILVGCLYTGYAQVEPHFSQYYTYPLWLNPALTGATEGNYRLTAIHRNQWSSITKAFSTTGVTVDVPTNKNINFGVNVLNQTAGSGGYKYFNGQFSISYSGVRFGAEGEQVISFALQAGMIGRRFDVSKFQGGDQWVPVIGYNPNVPTSDILAKSSSSVFDMGAGIAYYDASAEKKVNLFGGFSATHLTQPEDPFLSEDYFKAKMPIRYTVHGGVKLRLSDKAFAVPNALYMRQGNASEMMVGGYVQLRANDVTDVMAGLNYRLNDAIYPYVGIFFSGLLIGLSYDMNTSTLGKTAGGASSFEISLTFTGIKGEDKSYFRCPRF